MNAWIDALKAAEAPLGIVAGVIGTSLFNRRSVERKAFAESRLSDAQVPKIDAEAAKIIADTAVALVAPLREQITDLNNRVETLETENTTAHVKLKIAFDYIVTLLQWIARNAPDKTPPASPTLLGL